MCRKCHWRRQPLGQKDERHEQRGHAEQDAVVRRATAADALLQLGNFGVKNIWGGGGGQSQKNVRADRR